jgi:hypothetical protein
MKLILTLVLSLLFTEAFAAPEKEKFWLRLCDFGYKQSKLAGWQKQIGDVKYILIKDGVPLIGYSEKGIYFKDKKICDWKEVSRNSKDKKKYKQSDCPQGTPIELFELSEEDKKNRLGNSFYDSYDKYLIKLSVEDIRIQLDKLDELENSDYYLMSKINFFGDSFELLASKACEMKGDYSPYLIKQLFKEYKDFVSLFNDWVNCFGKEPFCKNVNNNISSRITSYSDMFNGIVAFTNAVKENPQTMVTVTVYEKIIVEYPLRKNDSVWATFTKKEELVDGKWAFGKWKLEIRPSRE